mmetsp:Transcript_11936/g.29208  ORF Transcript_11936/g.29208 Transcript_11936/m.29208 type:complete len:295 (+) Transcript_11936:165-1049(+)
MKRSILLSIGSLLGWQLSGGVAAVPRGRSPFGIRHGHGVDRIATPPPSSSMSRLQSVTANGPADRSIIAASCRGGECSDSNPALFAKIGFGAAVETGLMYALANLAVRANSSGYSKVVVRSFQAVALLAIIFGSASFGSLVDMGMSAASRQALDPNQIPGDADWYANLKKPSWNPPGWLFPIMWLIVSKPTQFMAVWKLITQSYGKDLSLPLLVYCAHLSLGDAWNKVFFGLECTGRGLAVILSFWSVLLGSAYLFYGVDEVAGLLMVPTSLWVTVATALNWSIYLNNKGTCDA